MVVPVLPPGPFLSLPFYTCSPQLPQAEAFTPAEFLQRDKEDLGSYMVYT